MEKETKVTKRPRNNEYDCFFCHVDLMSEREHLFHYIMGVAWYDRATYEQVEKLIDCYARMYADKSAEVEMLRTINEIEGINRTVSDSTYRNSDSCSVGS